MTKEATTCKRFPVLRLEKARGLPQLLRDSHVSLFLQSQGTRSSSETSCLVLRELAKIVLQTSESGEPVLRPDAVETPA